MTKLPMPQGSNALAGADSLGKGIARLRAKTGVMETRTIEGRCGMTGKGFNILFQRTDPRQRFTVASVEKIEPVAAGPFNARTFSARPAYNTAEFDLRGAHCPHCGSTRLVYHDGCGTTYCGATVRPDASGSEQFTCPACGDIGQLCAAETLQGASPSRRAADAKTLLGRFTSAPLLGHRRK
jgi:hypothetical protein